MPQSYAEIDSLCDCYKGYTGSAHVQEVEVEYCAVIGPAVNREVHGLLECNNR